MVSPMRSLTLPPGLSSSSFARMVGLIPLVTLCRRTKGVFPTRSRMLSEYFNCALRAPGGTSPCPLVGFYLSVLGVLRAKPAEEYDQRGDRQRHLAADHQHGSGHGLVDQRG